MKIGYFLSLNIWNIFLNGFSLHEVSFLTFFLFLVQSLTCFGWFNIKFFCCSTNVSIIIFKKINNKEFFYKNKTKHIIEYLKYICMSQMINKSKSFMTDYVNTVNNKGIIHGKYLGTLQFLYLHV